MKTIRIILFSLSVSGTFSSVQAQVAVAEDWTQTDCSGAEHNLFNTLDTGTAVVMEFIMLEGCMPCINAAHWMEPVIEAYNVAYNNRVQWYTFGYNDTYACMELDEWKETNEIMCDASFQFGEEISAYYGGMGMPTIVVAGRNTHEVYFNQFGFVPSDTAEFSDAISYALGLADPEVGIVTYHRNDFRVFPNPVAKELQLPDSFTAQAIFTISDITGRVQLTGSCVNHTIDVAALEHGMYFLTVVDGNERATAQFMRAD